MPLRDNLVHDGEEGIAVLQPPTNIGKVRTSLAGYWHEARHGLSALRNSYGFPTVRDAAKEFR